MRVQTESATLLIIAQSLVSKTEGPLLAATEGLSALDIKEAHYTLLSLGGYTLPLHKQHLLIFLRNVLY